MTMLMDEQQLLLAAPRITQTNETLVLADLIVDIERQRRLQVAKVREMVKHFDELAVGELRISCRTDGTLATIDGQHRIKVLIEKGYTTWDDCTVYRGLTLAEEAALFAKFNWDRGKPEPTDMWRVKLSAGDETALEIKRIIEECSCFVYTRRMMHFVEPHGIYAITSLERMYKDGGEDLIRTVLRIIMALWPNEIPATGASVLNGFSRFVRAYKDDPLYSEEELLRKFKETGTSLTTLAQRASGYVTTFGGDTTNAYALAICAVYNFKRRQASSLSDRLTRH